MRGDDGGDQRDPHGAITRSPSGFGVSYNPATGRAYVGDTGIQVFQIIATWHEVGHDRWRWSRRTTG
ncbi:MAG: hypothetical protein U0531_05795 [Dehalococcoidia bacterium]